MRRVSDLVDAIRKELPQVYRPQDGSSLVSQWIAPPLLLDDDVVVGGVPLNEFLFPPIALTASEFRGVYEEFVESFLVNHEDPSCLPTWMEGRLEIDSRLIPWYFPEGIEPLHALAVLVRLGFGVNDASNMVITTTSITVSVGGTLIGVEGTKVHAKFHQPEVEPRNYAEMLRGHAAASRNSRDTQLSVILAELHRLEDRDLRERLHLALRVLYFRYPHPGRHAETLYEGRRKKRKKVDGRPVYKELQPLLSSLPNPAPTLAQRLVGKYISVYTFKRLFKGIGPYIADEESLPPPDLRIAWNEGLKSLIKGENVW